MSSFWVNHSSTQLSCAQHGWPAGGCNTLNRLTWYISSLSHWRIFHRILPTFRTNIGMFERLEFVKWRVKKKEKKREGSQNEFMEMKRFSLARFSINMHHFRTLLLFEKMARKTEFCACSSILLQSPIKRFFNTFISYLENKMFHIFWKKISARWKSFVFRESHVA